MPISTSAALGAALLTSICLLPSVGRAQQCAEGRVASDSTAGRCCWPGQSWNDATARCQGPPACPAGAVAHGDECVTQRPAQVAAPPPAPPPQAALPAQPSYAYPPAGPTRNLSQEAWGARPETEPIIGLAATGGIMLGITYLATVVTASVNIGSCYGTCGWYALSYIPVAGAIAYTAIGGAGGTGYSSSADGWALAFYLPSAIVQTLSFTLMIAGLAIHRPKRPDQAGVDLTPELVAGPGDAGLGLRWTF